MISRQKQIAVVKQLISAELSKRGIKEVMQNILSQKSQYAEGNLNRVISKMSYSKMIKLRKTVFSKDGFLISFEVIVDLDFQGAPYAKFLDKSESKNPNSYALFSSRRNIVQNLARWMHQKKAAVLLIAALTCQPKKSLIHFYSSWLRRN